MRIGLIDVDGHRFPNLALMKISAWHKSRGDEVEWWWTDMVHYDVVYMSKVFSGEYTKDMPEPMNADKVIKGGTGYAIKLEGKREVYEKGSDPELPEEIERMSPDYTIYPEYDYAVSMTSRGCPRGCAFCHVGKKEGLCSVRVGDVSQYWCGQNMIKILDPNVLACREKREILKQYRETGALLDFTQGLDIRLMDDGDVEEINRMRLWRLHFAWDNPREDLEGRFRWFAERFRRKTNIGTVFCLTNFNSTIEEDLRRIYTLRDIGYDPYVMIYDKVHAPHDIRLLQRWCNNKLVFSKIRRFEDFDERKA